MSALFLFFHIPTTTLCVCVYFIVSARIDRGKTPQCIPSSSPTHQPRAPLHHCKMHRRRPILYTKHDSPCLVWSGRRSIQSMNTYFPNISNSAYDAKIVFSICTAFVCLCVMCVKPYGVDQQQHTIIITIRCN